jgi:sugar/nucleoside kinase (ribokinase family)
MPLEVLAEQGIERQRSNHLPLIITLGNQGCLVLANGEAMRAVAVSVPPPLDTVGAGDTFLSALAAGLCAGAAPVEAACLANLAAAVTVRKLHITGTASPEEVLTVYAALERG